MINAPTPIVVQPRWLTVAQAATHLQVGQKLIYRAVHDGQLRAARIANRRSLRFKVEWLDAFAESTAEPVEVSR
jgi:excisionase family DNA binding protein